MQENVSVKLVIIDHISSPSAIVFPVQKICIELKKLGVLVLVDGAHAPGQNSLNVEELGADFYTGNLLKWCYAPRGSAFLWVSPDMQGQIEPLVTSHMYNKSMADQFFMQGTADHTAYLCTRTGLQFYSQSGGLPALLDHTQALLDWAAEMLAEAFRTEQLQVPRNVILFSSDRGMAWVSRGMSRGRSPRDIPRETHAMPRSDEKRIILFHLTWTKGLELMFYFSLVADFPRHTAPSYTDFPRRPC